ncbi:MAG: mechanosensitive ion channel [Agathobacter sp.]|nr:mechanosensitive ion channel [Agathobacter sp.]
MNFVLTTTDTQVTDIVDNVEKNFLENYVDGAMLGVLDFAIDIILAFLVFLVGGKIIKWVVKLLRRSMERASAEQGVVTFVSSVCKYALYFVLILVILSHFGVTASSVIAVLGSAGLTLGLALQGSLSNFAGGVLILLLKPFVVGDYIIENSDKQEGTVTEITIFYTKLLTMDNKAIMIPNGTLSNSSIVNVTAMKNRRLDLRFGVAYDSDIAKVKKILEEIIKSDEAVLQEEDMNVFVSDLLDSSIDMGLRCWVKKEDYWTARWRIIENVKLAFDKEGISIPFPQMDVNLKK